MKILNPNQLPTIDYRIVKPLQGNLKDLHTDRHDKLLRMLERRGFTQPLNLWRRGDDFYLMDGHQRTRVMTLNDLNDDGNYEVPYIITEAQTETEAKKQLLEITSQIGTVTPDGLDEYMAEAELIEEDLDYYFDALRMDLLDDVTVLEGASDVEDKKTDKVARYTLEELKTLCASFSETTSSTETRNFLAWLASREAV